MMKPVIGITCRHLIDSGSDQYLLAAQYVQAIEREGGIAVILPAAGEFDRPLRSICDGLMLTGGGDLDPGLFSEEPHPKLGWVDPERDKFEISLIQRAKSEDLPVLGICRGMQMLNVALGGNMYQDLESQAPHALRHMQRRPPERVSHRVWVEEGTRLFHIIRRRRIWTNSLHHQAIKDPAPGFTVSARADDGVAEAIELPGDLFFLGVQWHPERLFRQSARLLFVEFLRNAREKAPAGQNMG